jgi:branched-chain amino acid transport system substrate-binding protein
MRLQRLFVLVSLGVVLGAVVVSGCGGGDSSDGGSDEEATEPIVIGTANSLTGALAPFETAINAGIDVAVEEINADGGVDGRLFEVLHVDAKSDLNLAATAALEAIENGADVVVPMCDADLGAPGALAANEKGVLAITCAGAPGIGRQAVGPLTFNTYAGAPTEGAVSAEFAYREQGWHSAYLMCDQQFEYMKVLCSAFETRWRELGGTVVGEDTFIQTDPTVAAQVTRLRNAPEADVLVLASYPGGSPALKEFRAAFAGPIILAASFSGTFWLEATPDLSNTWVPAVGSSYGDDPRDDVNAFFEAFEQATGAPALVDSYPLLGYSLVETLARGIERAGTTEGEALASALESFEDEPLLIGETTYTTECHVPVGRSLLMIEYADGEPSSTGEFVEPESVPSFPC